MTMQQKARTVVRGEVEATNDKGVKVNGQWWNYSRYHAVPHPYEDELVELTVTEGSNWIEGLLVVEDSKSVHVTHQPEPEALVEMPRTASESRVQPRGCRDLTISPSWPCSRPRQPSARAAPRPSPSTCSSSPTSGWRGCSLTMS